MQNPVNLVDPDGMRVEGKDNHYRMCYDEDKKEYKSELIDKEGGEFYDIIEYYGGELDGETDLIINPYIKESFNWFSENDLILEATIHRQGPGEWYYKSYAIEPISEAWYLPLPPVFRLAKGTKFYNIAAKGVAGIEIKNVAVSVLYKELQGLSLRFSTKSGRIFGIEMHQLVKNGAWRFHGHYADKGISSITTHLDIKGFLKEIGTDGMMRLLEGPISKKAGGIDKIIRKALQNNIMK